jgi:hypothetical protein
MTKRIKKNMIGTWATPLWRECIEPCSCGVCAEKLAEGRRGWTEEV